MQLALTAFGSLGAAAGAGATTAASTGAALAGTAISTFSTIAAIGANKAIAKQAAEVEEQNAKIALESGQIRAQDGDFEAASVLSDLTARQGNSGLAVGSGSFVRSRNRYRTINRTSRLRTIYDSEVEAVSASNRAASEDIRVASLSSEGRFAALAGAGNFAGDLLNDAVLTRSGTISATNRRRISL